MIPKVNKEYIYFDDGKINKSRKEKVLITDVVRFNKIDNETLLKWKEEVKSNDNLFAKETDYFVKAKILDNNQELIFVRTNNDGWFSFNNYMWDGRLDINGSLNAVLNGN